MEENMIWGKRNRDLPLCFPSAFECNGPLAQPAGDCLDAMGRRRSQDPQNRYKVLLNPFK